MSNLTSRRLITAGVAVRAATKGVGPGLKQPASGSGSPPTCRSARRLR
ncbi:hypothetical protein [Actinocorallia populi]|nr:hypothetical protein [Actinocorallia populi]